MIDEPVGQRMLSRHLGEMSAMSRSKWPPIEETPGYRIVEDRAYQGLDNDPACAHRPFCGHIPELWPEPRFWCRSITVERISDGDRGWAVGPQADAYRDAVRKVEARP